MNLLSSIYIHVPFCRHLCNYCDFYKRKFESPINQIQSFQNYLEKSFLVHENLMSQYNLSWASLETIYIGGGTPSLWGKEGAKFFKEWIKKNHLGISQVKEWTLEVDPDAWDEETIYSWRDIGVNRFSIGMQSFNDHQLKILDRQHTIRDIEKLLNFLKNKNLVFTVDFLLGIPELVKDSKRNITRELEDVFYFTPHHLSLYILNTRSNYVHKPFLPDDEKTAEEYETVSEYLEKIGLNHYEVSNFAKPGFESLHNQKYWRAQNVAGFGPSATGFFNREDGGFRYKWKISDPSYVEEKLDKSQLNLEKMYLSMRTNKEWLPEDWEMKQNEEVKTLLGRWVKEGFIFENQGHYRTLPKGYIILDSLISKLLVFTK
jgi:oxygen-independent coproporphyrinogen-3 oxidase